jgi:hypothetical protein
VTTADTAGVERTAARAALAVHGVAELQPSLGRSLANAATRARRALGSDVPAPEAGIHAEHTPRTGAWHVEVRCVVNEDRRALDTARDVRDGVRSAVSSQVNHHSIADLVTVTVTVTRITGHRPPPGPGSRPGQSHQKSRAGRGTP